MKRFYFDNWFAKIILGFSSCHTITIGPFVFSKRKEDKVSQVLKNHETIHSVQWTEITILSIIAITILQLTTHISAYWYILSFVMFYIWYILEFLAKLLILWNFKSAYKAVSFEQEANKGENDCNYIENRPLLSWMKYVDWL